MRKLKSIWVSLMLFSFAFLFPPLHRRASTNSNASNTSNQSASAPPEGQHDFDFEFGTWKTHLKRLAHPLSGSSTWIESDGTSVVRKIWNGRANLVELEVDGPSGHIEGLSLRLYNPQAHQWSLNFANSAVGTLAQPTVGEFKNGRGEFYDQEPFNGRTILVRQIWSDITPNSCRFEQSFSDDGGKTWEANWIATDTRVADSPSDAQNPGASPSDPQLSQAERDGLRGYDFELGTWKIHLSRLKDRLKGSTAWTDFDGTSVTRKVWNGRSQIEQFETDGAGGHIEGMTLRLFNPQTRQWSIYWATSDNGTVWQPTVGEFKNGVGEFLDREPLDGNGKIILCRLMWSRITLNSAHFEQSYSDDGGKTWEVNWITDQTRVPNALDKAH